MAQAAATWLVTEVLRQYELQLLAFGHEHRGRIRCSRNVYLVVQVHEGLVKIAVRGLGENCPP